MTPVWAISVRTAILPEAERQETSPPGVVGERMCVFTRQERRQVLEVSSRSWKASLRNEPGTDARLGGTELGVMGG